MSYLKILSVFFLRASMSTVCTCTQSHNVHMKVRGKFADYWFVPFTMQVPKIELRSSNSATNTITAKSSYPLRCQNLKNIFLHTSQFVFKIKKV